jgi:G3E family GTPase
LSKQKQLEDDLYNGVHDRALEKRIMDRPLVTDEKKEDAKEEEKEEAKEEEKKEERKESRLNNAGKDLVTLLAKVGWWTGVWKQETPLHPYDLPMFEGDMVTLNDDGTFTTKGSLNVADGNIWFNLVDGSLNLKRAQEPAEEPAKLEGLSNDYYMTYNHHETA